MEVERDDLLVVEKDLHGRGREARVEHCGEWIAQVIERVVGELENRILLQAVQLGGERLNLVRERVVRSGRRGRGKRGYAREQDDGTRSSDHRSLPFCDRGRSLCRVLPTTPESPKSGIPHEMAKPGDAHRGEGRSLSVVHAART